MGHYKWEYTPLERGFDIFYGNYLGFSDHFNRKKTYNEYKGYDWRNQTRKVKGGKKGLYTTYVIGNTTKDIISNYMGHTNETIYDPFFIFASFHVPHDPLQV